MDKKLLTQEEANKQYHNMVSETHTLDEWIGFRVTKLEKKVLTQKAKESDRPLGNYLRHIIFKRPL